MGIYVDTREKSNSWITKQWDEQGIIYKSKKLDSGDYAPFIPKNEALGIDEEISFDGFISIERKNSATELAGNFGKNRERFKREFERNKGKMIVMVEGSSYADICKGEYKSDLKPLSFVASIHSFQDKYDVPFVFIDKMYSAQYIYYTFYYWLKNSLKGNIKMY